jgi:hypothetical protein
MLGLATVATPAYAVSNVAVDLPNGPVAGGTSVGIPITIAGFAFSSVTVSLRADAGKLTLVDPNPRKSTSNLGFTSLVSQTELSFRGPTADIAALLQNGVSWAAPAGAASNLKIRVQVSEFTAGISFDPISGKSYRFVTSPLTWSAAQAQARTMTHLGKSGYLTNITSAAENTFVASRSGAANVWIGATSNSAAVDAARAPLPALTADPQLTGDYYWADGLEKAVQISTGLRPPGGNTAPVAVAGAFNGWATGEPNNFSRLASGSLPAILGEDCVVTNWQNTSGAWNDVACTRAEAYLVEFDTTAADFASALVTFDNITGTGVDAVPAVTTPTPVVTPAPSAAAVVPPAPRQLAATGTAEAAGIGGLAAALALLVGGGLLVATRRRNALSAE